MTGTPAAPPAAPAAGGRITAAQARRCCVLVADLVGSVRLMSRHEVQTVQAWRGFVAVARDQVLPDGRGTLVKSLGDGLLVTFPGLADAVGTACALHAAIGRLPPLPDALGRLSLRIGLQVGEVYVDELDVYGADVNLAARLAALGQPGDTVLPTDLAHGLTGPPGWQTVNLGPCWLKHVDAPVQATALRLAGTGLSVSGPARDLRPVVAVLPPASIRGSDPAADADARVLALAVADDLIAALSQRRELRVISRLSTQVFASDEPDLAALRTALKPDYVLSGSLRLSGRRAFWRVSMSDMGDTGVVWATQGEIGVDALFLGQEPMLAAVASESARRIIDCELHRGRGLPLSNLPHYTLFVAGTALLHHLGAHDLQRARELLQRLSELEAGSAAPHAMLAKWHLLRLAQSGSGTLHEDGPLARHHVAQALARDPGHALALSLQAHLCALLDDDLAQAASHAERALLADAQEPNVWLVQSALDCYAGRGEAGVLAAQQARELSPLDPALFLAETFLSAAWLVAGDAHAAAQAARRAIQQRPGHPASHRLLTIALVLGGHHQQAAQTAQALLRLVPDFSVGRFMAAYAGRRAAYAPEHAQALRSAGLPP
jgi:class 3 adenylate cyclase/TolB-like protein